MIFSPLGRNRKVRLDAGRIKYSNVGKACTLFMRMVEAGQALVWFGTIDISSELVPCAYLSFVYDPTSVLGYRREDNSQVATGATCRYWLTHV